LAVAAAAAAATAKQFTRRSSRAAEPAPQPESAPRPAPAPVSAAPAAPAPAPSPEPAPAPQPPAPAAPTPAAAPTPGEPDVAAVRAMWTTVRDKVRQRSRSTEAMLAGATVRTIDGNTLVLTHETASLARRLSEPRNTDVITEALKDALGVNWRVRCDAGGPAPESSASAAPAPADVESARRADEDAMLAEAAVDAGSDAPPRRDPEEVALELLQNELGARRISGD
ncbi:hypothetical protein WR43_22455, partial [Mycolicibacter arupensis]